MGLEISMRECGDVGVLDLLGRSTIDGGESELLSKHLRNLIAKGKRKLLLNLSHKVDSSPRMEIITAWAANSASSLNS